MPSFKLRSLAPPLLGCCLLIGGCSHDMSDLTNFVESVKARPGKGVDPVPQMRPYQPFTYARADARSPFEPIDRFEQSVTESVEASPNGLQPDLARNREPLEEFPLDGIRLLGTLEIRQQTFALLNAPDGIVHRATYGDHMGQNFGKIIGINDAEVQLEEIVPDGLGGYKKRIAVVAISETE